MMNETGQNEVAFVPVHGQMMSIGWLVVAPLGNRSYAVSFSHENLNIFVHVYRSEVG